MEEAIIAYDHKKVGLHARVKVRVPNAVEGQEEGTLQVVETTMGRIIFNSIVPEGIPYINEILTKRKLVQIIAFIFHQLGNLKTTQFLDALKDLGFGYATAGGLSISISDVEIPEAKNQLIDKAQNDVEKITQQYQQGFITNGERYNKVIDIWAEATERIAGQLVDNLGVDVVKGPDGSKVRVPSFNPIFMMADSGARGSAQQIRQLAGMRGLMAKPSGEIIETPIKANFREGLSELQYFISTHGARKGLADTALKTADAGYLTRRLVDVAQDIVVTEHDCGTLRGVEIMSLKEGEKTMEQLRDRIVGRVAAEDIFDPLEGTLICGADQEITEAIANQIQEAGIERVKIRSVLTCETERGVCQLCYGRMLGSGRLVEMGERSVSSPLSRSASRGPSSPCGPSTTAVPQPVAATSRVTWRRTPAPSSTSTSPPW